MHGLGSRPFLNGGGKRFIGADSMSSFSFRKLLYDLLCIVFHRFFCNTTAETQALTAATTPSSDARASPRPSWTGSGVIFESNVEKK